MEDLPETYDGPPIRIGIIGGTGLSHLPSFKPLARLPLSHPALRTPWGQPSSPIVVLSHPLASSRASSPGPPSPSPSPSGLGSPSASRSGSSSLTVAFLSRHGLHHELAPHEVPSRANIAALRKLGVRVLVAFSAVGSLREEVKPRDFLVPDQVIDRTKGVRPWTFFEGGIVGHIGFADPFDEELRNLIVGAVHEKGVLQGEGVKIHDKGTLICMEGPQFSTRAESTLYRSSPLSASVINMSCLPEAKLAREAELSYAMICMSTDYDSWHVSNEPVSVEMVMGHMAANAGNAGRVVEAVLNELGKGEGKEGKGGKEGKEGKEGQGVEAMKEGKIWEGQVRGAAGMTKPEGRSEEAVERLRWLFEGVF